MPVGFRDISGLTHQQAADGNLSIAEIPGDGGLGPVIAVITALASGLPPSDSSITLTLYPSEKFTVGTDSNGNISVVATFVNDGDDINYSITGGGAAILSNGFWAQHVRGQANNLLGTRGFNIQFLYLNPLDPGDFPDTLNDIPENLNAGDPSWDPENEVGSVTLSWDYDNTNGEDPVGFVLMRNGYISDTEIANVPIASLPRDTSSIFTSYEFTDFIFGNFTLIGTYTYTVYAYRYSGGGFPENAISGASNEIPVDFTSENPVPNIVIVGSGGIDFGGSAITLFIGDPSGIYTLVPDKKHDTLYERTDVDSINVKIPNPFIVTGFLGK
jgi:hypothetical protein